MLKATLAHPLTPVSPTTKKSKESAALKVAESDRFTQSKVDHNPLLYPAYQATRAAQKISWSALSAGLSWQRMATQSATFWGFPSAWAEAADNTLKATQEMGDRMVKDYAKPSFGLDHTTIGGQEVKVTEEVVKSKAFGNLVRFKRDTDRNDPKLLIIAPMSGHYATLLKGTVKEMLPNHDVYITDWKNARDVPLSEGDFGIDDYVSYIKEFTEALGENSHLLAVCQPTVPTLAAVSLMAQEDSPFQPLSMTIMGGPVDTRRAKSSVSELAQKHSIEDFEHNFIGEVPAGFEGAGRKVYPGFLQLSNFMSMNLDKHTKSHLELWQHKIDGEQKKAERKVAFYDEYLAVSDLPARFYLETVKEVFQDHDLADGEMAHFGTPVNPGAITKTAIFTVEGSSDDITPVGQTTAAHDLCENLPDEKRFHYLQEGSGHYGIFNGSKWRNNIAPRVTGFIRSQANANQVEHDAPENAILPDRFAQPKSQIQS